LGLCVLSRSSQGEYHIFGRGVLDLGHGPLVVDFEFYDSNKHLVFAIAHSCLGPFHGFIICASFFHSKGEAGQM
jgi:hypothetical protein